MVKSKSSKVQLYLQENKEVLTVYVNYWVLTVRIANEIKDTYEFPTPM